MGNALKSLRTVRNGKRVDLKQKESRLSAGLQKAPVKFVRFTNVSDEEQQVYLRQFVLTIEKK